MFENKILVCVRPSYISQDVIGYADRLSLGLKADLIILHVREPGKDQDTAENFEKFISSLNLRNPNVQCLCPEGSPGEIIVYEAKRMKVRLIAMAAHSHNSINEFFFGSVAKFVEHHSDCPVLLYKKPAGLNSVLMVPVDFTEINKPVIKLADEIASFLDFSLEFVHIVPEVDYYSGWTAQAYGVIAPAESIAEKKDLSQNELQLKQFLENCQIKSPYHYHVEQGHVHERLLNYQQIIGASLIMVAAHSKSFMDRLLHGGTTDRLLQQGNCSLFVYRTPTSP